MAAPSWETALVVLFVVTVVARVVEWKRTKGGGES